MTVHAEREAPFNEFNYKEFLKNLETLPTEDDLPYDDGEPMETAQHRDQMFLLIESLKYHWKERSNFYVGGNMFLHYDPDNIGKFRGPDFFLVLDVEERQRKSWVVWQERMRFPDVIIELLSDSTRRVDKEEKMDLYEVVFKTPEYYLYDPFSREFKGYMLVGEQYKEVWPDEERKIYSPKTGMYLKACDDWLRWMTMGGSVLPSPTEAALKTLAMLEQEIAKVEKERIKAEQESAKAEKERMRAELESANAKKERMRAELESANAEKERMRAEQESVKAEKERMRAEQERAKADQAGQRADEAEKLLEEYKKRYGNL